MFRATTSQTFDAQIPIACFALLLVCFAVPAFSQAGHVHELYYNNATWTDTDLMTIYPDYAPPLANPFGALASDHGVFGRLKQEGGAVYWVGSDQHLWGAVNSGSGYGFVDLTHDFGGVTASPFGLSAFSITPTNAPFASNVVYVGADSHVHKIRFSYKIPESDQDLTLLGGGPPVYPGAIVGMVTKPNNQIHVFYQELNTLDLHQLFFNGSSWSDEDLTSALGGAYCTPGWIAGFARANEQHIFCAGYAQNSNSLDMLHFYYNNNNWLVEDLTYASDGNAGTPMQSGSGVSAFNVPGANQLEVYGVTTDAHVHRYYHLGYKLGHPARWYDEDLSAEGAPNDYQIGGMVSFPTTPNNQFHVFYAPDNNVYQLFNPGTGWQVENITGIGQADNVGRMAGFAVGNEQHVFYISTGN